MIRNLFVEVVLCLVSCAAPVPEPLNLILLVDWSSSLIDGRDLIKSDIKEASSWWGQQASGKDGGRLEIMVIGTGIDDVGLVYSKHCPASFNAPVYEFKKRWMNDFEMELDSALEKLPSNGGSGIIEAMFRATYRLSEFEGKKVLIVFSDMREVNNDFNFENSIPEERAFYLWVDHRYLTPKFDGVTILITGFRPYPPNTTTKKLTPFDFGRLREFWLSLFHTWGADVRITERLTIKNLEGGVGQ